MTTSQSPVQHIVSDIRCMPQPSSLDLMGCCVYFVAMMFGQITLTFSYFFGNSIFLSTGCIELEYLKLNQVLVRLFVTFCSTALEKSIREIVFVLL